MADHNPSTIMAYLKSYVKSWKVKTKRNQSVQKSPQIRTNNKIYYLADVQDDYIVCYEAIRNPDSDEFQSGIYETIIPVWALGTINFLDVDFRDWGTNI